MAWMVERARWAWWVDVLDEVLEVEELELELDLKCMFETGGVCGSVCVCVGRLMVGWLLVGGCTCRADVFGVVFCQAPGVEYTIDGKGGGKKRVEG